MSGTVTDFKEPVQRTGVTSKQRKSTEGEAGAGLLTPGDGSAARAESPSSLQSKVGPEKELMESKWNKREETFHNHFEISKTVVLLVLGFRRGKTDPKNLGNEGKCSYQGSWKFLTMSLVFGKDKEFALILLPWKVKCLCQGLMFGEACPFVRGVGCHGHSRKNSRLGEILTFLTLGEKRVGLCFTSILASDHIIKKCFALLWYEIIVNES